MKEKDTSDLGKLRDELRSLRLKRFYWLLTSIAWIINLLFWMKRRDATQDVTITAYLYVAVLFVSVFNAVNTIGSKKLFDTIRALEPHATSEFVTLLLKSMTYFVARRPAVEKLEIVLPMLDETEAGKLDPRLLKKTTKFVSIQSKVKRRSPLRDE